MALPMVSLNRIPIKKDPKRLRKMLFEQQSGLTLAPLEIMFFSIGFMFIVLLLHIMLKIFPKTSPTQILVAVVMLIISMLISCFVRK